MIFLTEINLAETLDSLQTGAAFPLLLTVRQGEWCNIHQTAYDAGYTALVLDNAGKPLGAYRKHIESNVVRLHSRSLCCV